MKSESERFWSRVDRNGPVHEGLGSRCWLWTGSCFRGHNAGYGQIKVRGRNRQVHRFVWELTHETVIPQGLCVCHRCDTPRCCNPDHLFLGTNAQNIADRDAKRRQARGERNGSALYPERRPVGLRNGRAKLTEAQVLEVRARLTRGESRAAIARSLAVSATHIRRIARGESWKSLPQAAANDVLAARARAAKGQAA
jgi:hypothetical protein